LSSIGADPFRYYFNVGQHRFYFHPQGSESKYCSLEFLASQGILKESDSSIFIIYKGLSAPAIKFKGFFLDYRAQNGTVGLLHFQRAQ
jgi:hypothetical protein